MASDENSTSSMPILGTAVTVTFKNIVPTATTTTDQKNKSHPKVQKMPSKNRRRTHAMTGNRNGTRRRNIRSSSNSTAGRHDVDGNNDGKNQLSFLPPINPSLRWEYAVDDPELELARMEQYRENRRLRYAEAAAARRRIKNSWKHEDEELPSIASAIPSNVTRIVRLTSPPVAVGDGTPEYVTTPCLYHDSHGHASNCGSGDNNIKFTDVSNDLHDEGKLPPIASAILKHDENVRVVSPILGISDGTSGSVTTSWLYSDSPSHSHDYNSGDDIKFPNVSARLSGTPRPSEQ